MGNAASFRAGVAVGKALAVAEAALNSVRDAAEAVMGYLRTAASWALKKLKAAAASLKNKVMELVRSLLGLEQADEARREADHAAAAAAQEDAGRHVVLSRASARAAGFGKVQDVMALQVRPRPSFPAFFFATAPAGGALALQLKGVVDGKAARAARVACSEMMALLEKMEAALGDSSIPEGARSCILVVVAAVGICLEAIAAAAAAAAAY